MPTSPLPRMVVQCSSFVTVERSCYLVVAEGGSQSAAAADCVSSVAWCVWLINFNRAGAPSKSWRCYSPKCFDGASGAFHHNRTGCNICTSLLAKFMDKCRLHPPPPPPPPLPPPSGNASAQCITDGSYWCADSTQSHCPSDCTLARSGMLPPGAPPTRQASS